MELILVAEDTYLLKTFYRLEFEPQFVFQKLTDFLKFRFPFIKNYILFIDIKLVADDSIEKIKQFLNTFSIKVILLLDNFQISKKIQDFAINHCWGVITKNNLNISLPEVVVESQKNLQFFPKEFVSFVKNNSQKIDIDRSSVLEQQAHTFMAIESKLQYKINRLSRTVSDLKRQIRYMKYFIIFLLTSSLTLVIGLIVW